MKTAQDHTAESTLSSWCIAWCPADTRCSCSCRSWVACSADMATLGSCAMKQRLRYHANVGLEPCGVRTCQDEVSTPSVCTAVTKKTKHKTEEATLNWRLSWCYNTKDKRMAETLQLPQTEKMLSRLVFAPVHIHMGSGVLRSPLPASLFRAPIDGPGSQPTDALDHTSCASRALMPTLAQPPHVCHRQKHWAVSRGSHMQQDMDIS